MKGNKINELMSDGFVFQSLQWKRMIAGSLFNEVEKLKPLVQILTRHF